MAYTYEDYRSRDLERLIQLIIMKNWASKGGVHQDVINAAKAAYEAKRSKARQEWGNEYGDETRNPEGSDYWKGGSLNFESESAAYKPGKGW